MTITAPTTLAMPPTPRQFALVLDEEDEQYGEFVELFKPSDPVIWWGCQIGERVVLYRIDDDGHLDTARHASADHALDRWDRLYPLKLMWL